MDSDRLKALARIRRNTDYGKKASVREGDDAADQIRGDIIRAIAQGEASEALALLGDQDLGSWVAYTAAPLPDISQEQRILCVERIREIAGAGGVEGAAARMWLDQHGHTINPK